MTLSFSLSAKHDYDEGARRIEAYPTQLDGAMRDATPDALRLLEVDVARIISRIAGGVYWDINSEVEMFPNGARGRVVTPPSKPHKITPKGKGPLRFKIGNQWVSTYLVNHPGSNPVDWLSDIAHASPTSGFFRPYEEEVGEVFARA